MQLPSHAAGERPVRQHSPENGYAAVTLAGYTVLRTVRVPSAVSLSINATSDENLIGPGDRKNVGGYTNLCRDAPSFTKLRDLIM